MHTKNLQRMAALYQRSCLLYISSNINNMLVLSKHKEVTHLKKKTTKQNKTGCSEAVPISAQSLTALLNE